MATPYRFGNSQHPHFITFAVVNWIVALSRPLDKDIVVDSLKYCQQEKGLIINGWIIMSNHVHLITHGRLDYQLQTQCVT
jgi:putative transposase